MQPPGVIATDLVLFDAGHEHASPEIEPAVIGTAEGVAGRTCAKAGVPLVAVRQAPLCLVHQAGAKRRKIVSEQRQNRHGRADRLHRLFGWSGEQPFVAGRR